MREKPSSTPRRTARPRHVLTRATTRCHRPDRSLDATTRPQITIFLAWLSTSNMGGGDLYPIR